MLSHTTLTITDAAQSSDYASISFRDIMDIWYIYGENKFKKFCDLLLKLMF